MSASARAAWVAGRVFVALALIAAVGVLSARPIGYDFAAYWLAANRLLAGLDLYPLAADPHPFLGFGEYLYEPLTAVAFVPLALLDFTTAARLWFVALIGLTAVVTIALLRPLAPEARPWALGAIVLFFPLLAELTLGNLNLVTAALALLAWRLRARAALSGAALGAAVGLKLLPIALVAFYLAAGRWRAAGWAAGLGALAIAASLAFLGREWGEYLTLLGKIAADPEARAINVVPPVAALRYALPVLALAVVVAMGVVARRDRSREGFAHGVALAATPFVSPVVWYPYLVLVLPLLAALLGAAWPRTLAVSLVAVAWLALEVPSGRGPLPDLAFVATLAVVAVGAAIAWRRSLTLER